MVRSPSYQEQSIIDFYRINPASFRLYMTWDWHRRVLKKYGITKDCQDTEVSRISKNKNRIDNASEERIVALSFNAEVMVRHIFGIEPPWMLSFSELAMYKETDPRNDLLRGHAMVHLDVPMRTRYPCPYCGTLCKVHEREDRYYTHLPMCGIGLVIHARVPKLDCEICGGTPQMAVPWARPLVSYTKALEMYVFGLLDDMPVASVEKHTGLSMHVIWDMIRYRVDEALKRMDLSGVRMIYIDETSSRKGHNYVTVVCDQMKRIIFITEGKGSDTVDELAGWLRLHHGSPELIEVVSCDLGDAYPAGVRRKFKQAVIVYDRFHVVKLANEALDAVVRRYMVIYERLRGLRRRLMMNPSSLSEEQSKRIMDIVQDYREVAECYRLKIVLASIYDYEDVGTASRVLDLWYEVASSSSEPEMRTLAESIHKRREGILAWYDHRVSNGFAEGINSLIQTTKRVARGFRNIDNFIAMIYLRNGNLDIRFDRATVSVFSRGGAGGA